MMEKSKYVQKILKLREDNLNVFFYMWKCVWVYKIIIFYLLHKGVLIRYLKIENQLFCIASGNENPQMLIQG
jgi:hypothetical protein